MKRWTERFQQYQKAIHQLRLAVGKPDYSDLERAGLVQIFEFTFELGWKLMQAYNREVGYEARSPRESIQQAVLSGLISEFDGYEWLDALKDQNLFAHTYDEQRSLEAEALIKQRYYSLMEQLSTHFESLS
jgi:nucleotidyltransferase substrate binding protein (TIGR01987 family)